MLHGFFYTFFQNICIKIISCISNARRFKHEIVKVSKVQFYDYINLPCSYSGIWLKISDRVSVKSDLLCFNSSDVASFKSTWLCITKLLKRVTFLGVIHLYIRSSNILSSQEGIDIENSEIVPLRWKGWTKINEIPQ